MIIVIHLWLLTINNYPRNTLCVLVVILVVVCCYVC
jgi:hypothetical protein